MKKWGPAVFLFLLVIPVVMALSAADQPPPGSPPAGGLLHGDTSVPDDVLIKQYGDKIPAEIMMNDLTKKMPPVKFPHQLHVDKKTARCGNCHHKEVKNIQHCSKCHTEKPDDPKASKYDKAHHDLCVACHKTKQKPGPTPAPGETQKMVGPPIKCNNCHKKENLPPPKPAEAK